jgi:DNA ligase-1
MKKFKPQLAPNEQISIDELPYPLLASYKYDGIRCIFKNGEMVSRSLKTIPNVKLHEKFEALKEYTRKENIIFDGELYTPEISFPELSGLCRRLDEVVPDSLNFYCFDVLTPGVESRPFRFRLEDVIVFSKHWPKIFKPVVHIMLENSTDTKHYFNGALNNGFEGLILRHPEGKYKYGRGTLKEGLIYKLKPYITFDAKIIEVIQGTEVDPNAEKKINELGYSETSKKKGDRIPVDKACDFVVMHEGEKRLKVMIAMTDKEKKEVWKNRESYIGRWIEYKGLVVGSKDLPRHPVFLRFRDDKE